MQVSPIDKEGNAFIYDWFQLQAEVSLPYRYTKAVAITWICWSIAIADKWL